MKKKKDYILHLALTKEQFADVLASPKNYTLRFENPSQLLLARTFSDPSDPASCPRTRKVMLHRGFSKTTTQAILNSVALTDGALTVRLDLYGPRPTGYRDSLGLEIYENDTVRLPKNFNTSSTSKTVKIVPEGEVLLGDLPINTYKQEAITIHNR